MNEMLSGAGTGLDLATFMNSALEKADNGMGGQNGWLWLLVILLFAGNGNFFGRQNGANVLNDAAITGQIEAAINKALSNKLSDDIVLEAVKGNRSAIDQIACALNADSKQIESSLCCISRGIDQLSAQYGMGTQQIINAVQAGNCTIERALADCCCRTQQLIANQGYETRIQNMQQTQELTNTMRNGFDMMNNRFNNLEVMMNQQFCDIKTREDQREIQTLRDQLQDCKVSSLIQQQTNLINNQFGYLNMRVPERPQPCVPVSPYYPYYPWTCPNNNNTGNENKPVQMK